MTPYYDLLAIAGQEKTPFRKYAWPALLLLAFLFLTGYHLGFYDAIKLVDANDVYSYLKISSAAPSLPSEPVPFHFAQRFIPHYLVGYAAAAMGIRLETSYFIFNIILVAFIFTLSARLLFRRGKPYGLTLLAFALMALSPYAFRLNLLVPGMLADMVYSLGLVLCLTGLAEKKMYLLFFGAVLAATGKQMILLVLPGLLLYTFFVVSRTCEKWKALVVCVSLAALVLGYNSLLAVLSSGFAGRNTIDGRVIFSLFPWLLSPDFSVFAFAEHLLRVFLPAVPFVMLLAKALEGGEKRELFALENGAILLIILGPAAYAFFPGPAVQMQNQSRYTASAVLPMALLALNAIPAGRLSLGKKDLFMLAPILMAYSYHHKYCFPQATPEIFLFVQLASLAGFFSWLTLRFPSVKI